MHAPDDAENNHSSLCKQAMAAESSLKVRYLHTITRSDEHCAKGEISRMALTGRLHEPRSARQQSHLHLHLCHRWHQPRVSRHQPWTIHGRPSLHSRSPTENSAQKIRNAEWVHRRFRWYLSGGGAPSTVPLRTPVYPFGIPDFHDAVNHSHPPYPVY